jgi:hypothetical protein
MKINSELGQVVPFQSLQMTQALEGCQTCIIMKLKTKKIKCACVHAMIK